MPGNRDHRSSISRLPPVERVELFHVRLPLQHPFRTSFGMESHRESVLIRLRTPDGDGWGEAPVGQYPRYTHESTETAWYILNDFLAPTLVECAPRSYEEWHDCIPFIRGHHMARGAVLMGLVDLAAKQRGELLGTFYGAPRNEAYAGISIGLKEDRDDLFDRIQSALELGYLRIKLKIEPGSDIDLLREVREAFPEIDLMVDGNGGYDQTDISLLQQIDSFDLLMLEQPFGPRDFTAHAALQEKIETPICLDESIETFQDAQLARQLNSCRIINIKSPRLGGPLHALDVYKFCEESGLDVFCGGLLETGIGRAHNVGLASLPRFQLPGDLSESQRYFPEDLVEPEFELTEHGSIKLPEGRSGIGVKPVLKRIREQSKRSRTHK